MNLKDLYTYIFPFNGITDDNNRYIDMSSSDISTIQLLEPTVGVSEFVINPKDRLVKNNLPDRMSFRIPMVAINDYMLRFDLITNFYLDYSSFVPSVMVEFIDYDNQMLSINSIRDGSIIKVYIGGNGDELYYKPIRQDFVVTNISKINSGNQNVGDWIQYRLYGTLNVPMGHRKDTWSNSPSTSVQELFNLSIYTGLGFATNFTNETIDKMKWINPLGRTFFQLMENIASHACYSPNTFFTAFVDQYYVLNFIECHSLLSHGGDKKDIPAMIYPNIQSPEEPNVDKSANDGKNRKTTDQINVNTNLKETDLMNSNQKLSYYFLSNHEYFNGWSNYIESYNEISNGYSSMDDGYRRHVIYSDSNSGKGWGCTSEFIISPIDNLERESSTQKIKSLPDDPKQNTHIPLNLMQTNNFEYQKSGLNDIDRLSSVESYIDFGEVDTSNMYKQYYFAEVQNDYQMRCMKKCGLNLILQNYNPSITKFSRIWVDLYDMNPMSTQEIAPTKVTNPETLLGQALNDRNENIINYSDEGVIDMSRKGIDENGEVVDMYESKNTNFPRGNYNRSLSGWYVITEMKIVYDNFEKNMKTHLVLNRIEHKPLYHNEYKLAKEAIDKYKEENRIECVYGSIDDYSYN